MSHIGIISKWSWQFGENEMTEINNKCEALFSSTVHSSLLTCHYRTGDTACSAALSDKCNCPFMVGYTSY